MSTMDDELMEHIIIIRREMRGIYEIDVRDALLGVWPLLA
jgi:hypothetical protein